MINKFFASKTGLVLICILCTFLWGSAFPLIKAGYEIFEIADGDIFGKILFAGIRFFMGGIIVLILHRFISGNFKMSFPKENTAVTLMAAFFGITLSYLFFYLGLGNTTGVKGSIFNTASTFMIVIMAWIIFKDDKVSPLKICGLFVGLAGILFTSLNGETLKNFDFNFFGDGFVLISGFFSSVTTIIVKTVASNIDTVKMTFWQLVIGGGALVVIGLAGGGGHITFTPAGILLLAYGAVISGVGFTFTYMLLKYHNASKVESFKLLIPIFGSLLSVFTLKGESITLNIILGLVCCCAGIYFINSSAKKER